MKSNGFAIPDLTRHARKGVPEVILADGKTVDQCISITRAFLKRNGRAILSKVGEKLESGLKSSFPGAEVEWVPACRAAVVRSKGARPRKTGGRVGILTAGTSDIPAAEEAALLCREMGCSVYTGYDVGVAGLHRLVEPLREMIEENDVDVLIVAAGMDGALPSVVAGLAPVPVVGLPTSIGYGLGGGGIAALYAMLQSCAPGLSVVNIDNGIGAGVMAGMIANRAARARARREDKHARGRARAQRGAGGASPRARRKKRSVPTHARPRGRSSQ
jgi:NCAIR mutase (PurE)-related protein